MTSKANAPAPGQQLAKKLSIATLGLRKPDIQALVLADRNAEHFLARFVGVATQPKPYKDPETGDMKFGLMGQFEGTSREGVVLNSAVAYLPTYAMDMVLAALSLEDVQGVNIAFDIYAIYDEDSATSYTFNVRDLLNQGAHGVDEVKAQIASLPAAPKTLALPSA
jgi:hypothetical protein